MLSEEEFQIYEGMMTQTLNAHFRVGQLVRVLPLNNINGHEHFEFDFNLALIVKIEEIAETIIYTVLGSYYGKYIEIETVDIYIEPSPAERYLDQAFLDRLNDAFEDRAQKVLEIADVNKYNKKSNITTTSKIKEIEELLRKAQEELNGIFEKEADESLCEMRVTTLEEVMRILRK